MATNDEKVETTVLERKSRPIIIKRVRISGHGGHHGGAWKVAYADFVTAMMAFFLLLWLLNTISSDKLSGIADYFEPTIGIEGGKGIGFNGGKSNSQKDGIKYNEQAVGFKYGVTRTGEIIDIPKDGVEVTTEEENMSFEMTQKKIQQTLSEDNDSNHINNSVNFTIAPEGLIINILDQDKYPMFEQGKADLTVYSKNILFKIANIIRMSSNFVAIVGHTDKGYTKVEDVDYSEWELSADRANAARRYLLKSGVPTEQISRISALADNEPLDASNKYNTANRRIEIILLRKSIIPYYKISAPHNSLSEPSPVTESPPVSESNTK